MINQVPEAGSEYGADAAALLASLVGGGSPVIAQIIAAERPQSKVKHPATNQGKLFVELHSPG